MEYLRTWRRGEIGWKWTCVYLMYRLFRIRQYLSPKNLFANHLHDLGNGGRRHLHGAERPDNPPAVSEH